MTEERSKRPYKIGESALIDGIYALLARDIRRPKLSDLNEICEVTCKTCRHYQAKVAYAFYSVNHYANKQLPCNSCEAFARWEL